MGTHPQTHAVLCPFCKGAVPDSLTRFGGNCPHCMLEIPGEEAPTDPGLQARLKKQQDDQRAAVKLQKRNRLLGGLVVVVMLGVAGGGYLWWQGQRAALTYEMDDYYEIALDDLKTAPNPVAAADPAVADAQGPPTPGTPRKRPTQPTVDGPIITGTSAPESASGDLVGGPKRASGTTEDAVAANPTMSGGQGGPSLGVAGISISRPEIDQTLSDPTAIRDMVKRTIDSFNPQMQTCANQRLKAAPELAGAWRLSFVIAKDGTTNDVDVEGVNVGDDELEACLVRTVKGWRFQRIAMKQPVNKTYRFGTSGW